MMSVFPSENLGHLLHKDGLFQVAWSVHPTWVQWDPWLHVNLLILTSPGPHTRLHPPVLALPHLLCSVHTHPAIQTSASSCQCILIWWFRTKSDWHVADNSRPIRLGLIIQNPGSLRVSCWANSPNIQIYHNLFIICELFCNWFHVSWTEFERALRAVRMQYLGILESSGSVPLCEPWFPHPFLGLSDQSAHVLTCLSI